jgi:Na+-translocating ferredoxin:NAD+ oxidoreductase RNF subunit RnfB
MDILIAFGVVAGIALILGILLAIVSRFFAVEDDTMVKNVRACLPGVNCGACGYKGCDDYAAAVAGGKAKPNLCIPGAETTAAELSELLGIAVEAPADVVAFVHCNGSCGATSKKAEYAGIPTCRAASMLYAGPDACRFGCIGLGDCAKACPSNAICMKDGIAHVDTERCIGCGLCNSVCPKHIISMVPQETEAVVMCSNTEKAQMRAKPAKTLALPARSAKRSALTARFRL